MADKTYVIEFRDDGSAVVTANIKRIGRSAANASKGIRTLLQTIKSLSVVGSGIGKLSIEIREISSEASGASSVFSAMVSSINNLKSSVDNLASIMARGEVALDELKESTDASGHEMRQLNTTVGKTNASLADLARNGLKRAEEELEDVEAKTKKTTRAFAGMRRVLGTLATYFGVRELIRYSDAWTNISNAIKVVADSENDLIPLRTQLLDITKETRSSLEGNVKLYQRLTLANKNLGKSEKDRLKFTKLISQALAVGGASAEEARSVTLQLSQGLGSVAVRGEEFRAIQEGGLRIMKALQDQTGKTTGELVEMTAAGNFLSKDFFEAIMAQAPQIDEDFKKMNATISQSGSVFSTSLKEMIGKFNDASGSSEKLANSVIFLAQNLDTVAISAGLITALGLAKWASTVKVSFAALNTILAATVTLLIKTAAVGLALFGIAEAFKTFINETKTGAGLILSLAEAMELAAFRMDNWKRGMEGDELTAFNYGIQTIKSSFSELREELDNTDFGDANFGEKLNANLINDAAAAMTALNAAISEPRTIVITKSAELEEALTLFERMKVAYDELKESMSVTTFFEGVRGGFASLGEDIKDFGMQVADITKNAIRGFADELTEALTGGTADFKAFARSAINSLISLMIQAIITKAVVGAFGGAGGAGGAVAGAAMSGRQFGGPVQAGQPVMVGERRPEIFVPQTAGRIEQAPSGGESGGNTSIVNVVDPQMFLDAMSSTQGQKVVMNIISKNKNSLRG